MPVQTYQNHVRHVPLFAALALALMATCIGSCVNLARSWGDHQRLYSASLIVVLSFCGLLTALFARRFALVAQDRAIRAEENLRHYVLTGKLLDPRLGLRQVIALRFASDAEFAALAARAAEEGMEPDAIKRAVQDWRADLHRV